MSKRFRKRRVFLIETDKCLNELSKGNQKKIMLYLAFLKDNEIVFLDEPFDGLDKDILKRVINYINDNSE